MQSRRLRLGDVVDDYCPRERRLSNHVIAAMVDDTIKQTRCATCDFEHPYKGGKLPARRAKKDSTTELFKQVLDNVADTGVPTEPVVPPPRGVLRPNGTHGAEGDVPESRPQQAPERADETRADVPVAAASSLVDPPDDPVQDEGPRDEGPVHRTLIRATLPRVEGDVPVRPIPTFTIREAAAAPKFRRFRPKRGPGGGRPMGDDFGNQIGYNKNPQFGAQPGRGQGHGPKSSQPRSNQQPRPGGSPGGRRNNNNPRRNNKGPR